MSRQSLLAGTAILSISSTAALAGGLERTVTSISPLFEEGRYLEFSAAIVSPDLEGEGGLVPPTFGGPLPLTGSTGDLLDSYVQFGAAYKADINDRLSYAIIVNQPYGASTVYPDASAALPDVTAVYNGSDADVSSVAITGLLAYDATDRIKIYGGPIIQAIKPQASISFVSNYDVEASTNYGFGYTFGAAYSVPDIAFRAALTYRSEIEHDLDTTETSDALGVNETETVFDTPESLTLDLQTGIAKDTLLFGQIHWADWSEFAIAPPNYITLTGGRPLVDYSEDWTAYTIGIGHRFDENWSGAVSILYEPQTDTELTSLGPIDGRTGINLGATYETETMKISGGVSYTMLGDARNVLETDFDDGDAIGVGFKIGWKL
jgi:long-chain fatty acid transport protein